MRPIQMIAWGITAASGGGWAWNWLLSGGWAWNWLLNWLVSYWQADTNWSFPDIHWAHNWVINWSYYSSSWKINWCYNTWWRPYYIWVAHNAAFNSNNNSYAFWVKSASVTKTSNIKWLFCKALNTWYNHEMSIGFQWTTWYIQATISSGAVSVTTIWTTDAYDLQWHSVVVTKEYWVGWDTITIYVDWVYQNSQIFWFNAVQNSNEIVMWKFTTRSNPVRYFDWWMDEIALWNVDIGLAWAVAYHNAWSWLPYWDYTV